MRCTVVSPHKTLEFQRVISATLPAWRGQMEILTGHAEAFIILQKGEIVLKTNKVSSASLAVRTFSVSGGICRVKNNEILIIL
jgi:F0F1-type ATP synthase epsilon subunit